MKVFPTAIAGVHIVETEARQDARGSFSRLFCAMELKDILGGKRVLQINQSTTVRAGAIRGLHYQHSPHAEMKIVRCLGGRVFDVAVDLRRGSPSFLRWTACELSAANRRALVVPEGCAHGFQTLEADSRLLYLHTQVYKPEAEGAVRFDEARIGIDWPLVPTDISARDREHPYLSREFEGIAA